MKDNFTDNTTLMIVQPQLNFYLDEGFRNLPAILQNPN